MSKSRRKHGSELEHLRGEIRRLKAQLKQCHRHKRPPEEPEEVREVQPNCDSCGKGVLQVIDLKWLKLHRCPVCGFEIRERTPR